MSRGRWTLVLLLATSLSSRATAQTVEVTLRGRVVDPTGAPVPDARVTVVNRASGLTRSAMADIVDGYVLVHLPPGVYDVTADRAGFASERRRDQALHVGATVRMDFVLPLAPRREVLDVSATGPALQTIQSAPTRIVQRAELDTLPVLGRNFSELAALAPGVTPTGVYGGPEISGSRDFHNAYLVDGVSAEGQRLGNQRIAFSADWIEEFQVLTSQHPVEFGQASGGVLHAVTRSGGNRVSGRAYGFFRDEALDARPAFSSEKTPLEQQRAGITLGGPLAKDRLFFFGGFEYLSHESRSLVRTAFPSVNGAFPYTEEQKLFLLKLDLQAGPSHRLVLRGNGDLKQVEGTGVGGRSAGEHGLALDATAGDVMASWTGLLGPQLLSELRVAHSTHRTDEECLFARGNPPGTWFERAYPGALLGCPNTYGTIVEDQVQAFQSLSGTRGAHAFKGGFQAQWLRPRADVRHYRDGSYAFERDIPFDLANPASHPYLFIMAEGPEVLDRQSIWAGAAFLQDRWQAAPELTLTFGVRYDLDASFTVFNDRIRVDRGFRRVRVDTDNVAPRFGFEWTPVGQRKGTMLRGGAGVFYDQNHTNLVGILLVQNLLVDRGVVLNANNRYQNPIWPDTVRAKRYLAEALARNTVPDTSLLPFVPLSASSVDGDIETPGTIQATGGIVHDFGAGVTASMDFVYSRGFDQFVSRDVNTDPVTFQPINPLYVQIFSFGNGGYYSYRALQMQASWVPSARSHLKLAYTRARNVGNTLTFLSGAPATNPHDLSEDLGPTNNDVRHVLTINGSTSLPWGTRLSGILSYRSALPYSTVSSVQLDDDPWPDRPEPRNSLRQDSRFSLDLRLARVFGLGGHRALALFVEAFNVTNAENLTGYNGFVDAEAFGEASSADPKRRVQLGARLDF
jgi:hypothetical protein